MGITKKTNTTGRTPMTTEGILAKNERRKAELLAKMDKDREITEKQKHFAELIAHDIDRKRAYTIAYDVSADTKPVTIDNASRRLLANPLVLNEIDRIKQLVMYTKGIDGIEPEKKVEILDKEVVSANTSEWTQKTAFKKFADLLNGCEESLILLKERPTLFGECRQMMNDVRKAIQESGVDNPTLTDIMSNIQDIIYKLGTFDVKEYNSTVNTATQIMKVMNDITGVGGKNAKAIEDANFEKKLLLLIDNIDRESGATKRSHTMKEEAIDYAFGGADE